MFNFIRDEVKILGLQTFERYEKLNPVETSIKESEINTFLSRFKCNKYRLIINNLLFNSGECPQIFRGMSPNIAGNDLKYSGECFQTIWEMSQNIPRNIGKLLSLISECFTAHYVLISSNEIEYLYI